MAFIRGFARERSATLGNFWVDLVRALLWVLLPLSFVGGLVLVWQAVPLNVAPYSVVRTLEGREQLIAQGPVATLELIKNLGTNGGGFFNANGAHPYENPTPLTNFIALLAIAVLPASFPIAFGAMVGRPRAGWAVLAVMVALVGIFMGGLMIGRTPEYLGKTIKAAEANLIAWYTLLTPLVVSVLTAWATATEVGRAGLATNGGSRGFTEILFAYASCMANNGQTMAGLNANSPFYNLTTAVAMLAGRFGLAALALALAGRFAAQVRKPETIGSMPCDTPTFGALVLGSVVLVGALSFLPALALGPIAEHLHP